LELDMAKDGGALGYLTCTKVDDADFPWDWWIPFGWLRCFAGDARLVTGF
jgi:hypothetical protein